MYPVLKMDLSDFDLPFWDHVAEFRRTLLWSLMTVLVGGLVCFFFYQEVFHLLTRPLQKGAFSSLSSPSSPLVHQDFKYKRIQNPTEQTAIYPLPSEAQIYYLSPGTREFDNKNSSILHYAIPPGGFIDLGIVAPIAEKLLILGPSEGLSMAIKVCFLLGVILASPLWMFFILKFIHPAFKREERSLVLPFILLSWLFLSGGAAFAYFLTLPMANHYLQTFNASIGTNFWSVSHYLNFALFVLFANALAFEMGLVLFFLVHRGILSLEWLTSKRRPMYVLAFIIGAVLTPPDVLTQFLVAIPLIVLYELAIVFSNYKTRT
jgi:sec-independent protein translocase protein TatC